MNEVARAMNDRPQDTFAFHSPTEQFNELVRCSVELKPKFDAILPNY
jgi:hypothetical protein